MLEDKLPQVIKLIYNIKVLVAASYKAQQTLAAKGLTPAIFLDPFYSEKSQNLQQISYNFKQKQIKPLPDYITVDIADYTAIRREEKNSMDDIDQELLSRRMSEMLNEERLKFIKDVKKDVFQDKGSIEKFINNQGFHWFEKVTKTYYHALTMGQDNYRVNTSDQPLGICYVIQVEKQKSVKQIFEKIKTDSDFLLRKLYELNPDQIANIKPILIVLYDVSRGNTVQQALDYCSYLKSSSTIHTSLMYRLAINSEDTADLTVWSRFVRPVLHFKYDIKGSDPIRIIGEEGYTKLQEVVNHHKETIRRNFEIRLDDLIKKHENVNKVTNIIGNFFKGNTPNEKTYNKQQIDLRQLADKMFIVEDYKRAYDIYKNLAGKLDKRNAAIENNLSQMIQLCLVISKFHNLKLKSDPYNEIEKYVEKIFRYYENKSKLRLKKYLIFLVYAFHTFRTFNREFIRSNFYPQIKQIFSNNSFLNVIPSLLYEQFANFNLLYKNIDYRRYCYDMTRVASRYSDGKLYSYALRSFLVVESLYKQSFANIEKYQYTQLSHLFIEARNYKQSLRNLKSSWEVYNNRMETQDLQKNQGQLVKLIQNYNKMIRQIEKVAPFLLNQSIEPNLKIPIIHSLNMQTKDQMLQFDEKSGMKWQEIGEAILDNKELMSAGLNQRQFRNLFRSFDFGVPEEKYLIYKFNSSFISQAILKKNSRNTFAGQPIKLTFYMRNPLRGDIDVENIRIKLKQSLQQVKVQTKCRELAISSFKSSQVTFVITPNEPGFLELEKIEWSFMKLFTYHQIKEPSEIKSDIKSCFFKLNVLPPAGCLESKAYFEDYYYQGQRTRMKLIVKNFGKQKIDKLYIAPGEDEMFGFKLKQLNLEIQPNQEKQIYFDISIPLVHDTIQSGQQKRISKMLILYKTNQKYRISRTINKFNILRIAKIQKIVCQRLSTHLHLLSFSKKKFGGKEDPSGLEWMIIPAGYDIVKNQAADLASQTNYFFFIRKGNHELSKFRFQNWAKDINTYPEQFFNFNSVPESLNIRFFWRKQQKIGYISKLNIPVIVNEHGYLSSVFPISFKINYQKEIWHNFKKTPFLQVPISIKLKNVLCNDELKVAINFVDSPSSDSTWEGVTERKVSLKMGSEVLLDLKYIVVRPGTYLLSNQIKYSIVNSKTQSVNLTHSQYEKIYLTVKAQNENPNKMDFEDAFKQFAMLQQKTVEIKIQPDSLI